MDRFSLVRGNVKVEWTDLGESLHGGDFNPDDPNDVAVLRFDVSVSDKDGNWSPVDDASYCTAVRTDEKPKILMKALRIIMENIFESLQNGESIKKICEKLSWLGTETAEAAFNLYGKVKK